MVSDAEVWRRNAVSRPCDARHSRRNPTTSRVMSMKPTPCVSTVSVAVSNACGTARSIPEIRVVTSEPHRRVVVLAREIFADVVHHLHHAFPGIGNGGARLFEIGL